MIYSLSLHCTLHQLCQNQSSAAGWIHLYSYYEFLACLIRETKQKFRREMNSTTNPTEGLTTNASLERKYRVGCSVASKLLLNQQRLHWEWCQFPRSVDTYQHDGFNNITSQEFSHASTKVRSTTLAPSIQWTSTQILLRTIWTKVKEGNSR